MAVSAYLCSEEILLFVFARQSCTLLLSLDHVINIFMQSSHSQIIQYYTCLQWGCDNMRIVCTSTVVRKTDWLYLTWRSCQVKKIKNSWEKIRLARPYIPIFFFFFEICWTRTDKNIKWKKQKFCWGLSHPPTHPLFLGFIIIIFNLSRPLSKHWLLFF